MQGDGFPGMTDVGTFVNKSLDQLTGDDLGWYVGKAMTTWGSREGFQAFPAATLRTGGRRVLLLCRFLWRVHETPLRTLADVAGTRAVAVEAFMLAVFRATLYQYLVPSHPRRCYGIGRRRMICRAFFGGMDGRPFASHAASLGRLHHSQATSLGWHERGSFVRFQTAMESRSADYGVASTRQP